MSDLETKANARHRGPGGGRKRLPISPREIHEIVAASGASYSDLARLLGCTKRTIVSRMKEPRYRRAYDTGKDIAREHPLRSFMCGALMGNTKRLIRLGKSRLVQQ